jgi:hypothetical protein
MPVPERLLHAALGNEKMFRSIQLIAYETDSILDRGFGLPRAIETRKNFNGTIRRQRFGTGASVISKI